MIAQLTIAVVVGLVIGLSFGCLYAQLIVGQLEERLTRKKPPPPPSQEGDLWEQDPDWWH